MHLLEGLLHREDVGGTRLHKWGTLASEGAQSDQGSGRPKRRFEEPRTMQSLHPLAVQHIALASWAVRERLGADQTAL